MSTALFMLAWVALGLVFGLAIAQVIAAYLERRDARLEGEGLHESVRGLFEAHFDETSLLAHVRARVVGDWRTAYDPVVRLLAHRTFGGTTT